MKIKLSDHFSYGKLIKFTLPTIIMMIFTSIYGVVDGVFVSNFVGSDAFAAVNLIMPVVMILGSVGFMIGTGGSAIVSKTLGEGKKEKAREYFSLHSIRCCTVSNWNYIYTSYSCGTWCKWQYRRRLCNIWKNTACYAYSIIPAKCFPELSCCS